MHNGYRCCGKAAVQLWRDAQSVGGGADNLNNIRCVVSSVCTAAVVCWCKLSTKGVAGVPRDHGNTRRQGGVLFRYIVNALWFGVILDTVPCRIEGIVSRPHRLRPVVIRSCEELLLVVGLIVLSIGVGHPAFGRLHVMELRTLTLPLELMLWTRWRRVGGACCNGTVLSTVVVSQCAPRVCGTAGLTLPSSAGPSSLAYSPQTTHRGEYWREALPLSIPIAVLQVASTKSDQCPYAWRLQDH